MDNLIEKSCLFIINTLYYQTIFCTILFIFIFGLTYFLRGKSPRLLLGLWFLILIRLLLPTDLSFSLSARNLFSGFPIMEKLNVSVNKVSDKLSINQQPYQNPASIVSVTTEDQRNNRRIAEWDLDKGRTKMISWPIILTIAWFLGCLITLTLFLIKIHSINRVLDRSSLVREKEITAFLNYWCLSFKIKRPVTIFSSDEFLSPFTVGLFRPKIFIPKPLLETRDNETINSIIAHEIAHIKRFDYVWIRFQNALQIIYFFNPVVWYANRQISMARERICDSIVLAKQVIPPKEYGKGVIDVLKFNLFGHRLIDPLPCFSNHKKIFEHRIKDIIKQSAMTKQKTLFILLMVCLLGLFLLPMSKIEGLTPAKDVKPYQPGDSTAAQNLSMKETVDETRKPGALVNVTQTDVTPTKGYAGMAFTFTASTDIPATAVTLKIAGKEFPMTGSGANWTLKQKIEKTGNLSYAIVAINEDNEAGTVKTGTFDVLRITERYIKNRDCTVTDKVTGKVLQRFVDNGDGTVTDITSNMMWAQSPIKLSTYDEAEEYCSNLSLGGHSGWRLPTASEWKELIDTSQKAPALPVGHPFKNIDHKKFFWSKTKSTRSTQRIYVTNLNSGKIAAHNIMTKEYYIWPVRAADYK